MREEAVLFGEERSLVGIVTEPPGGRKSELPGWILLNAGLVHRVGPNRLYVKTARMLAALGFVVLRFDLSGLGDSPARRDSLPRRKSVILEAQEAMELLGASRGVETFILSGLCSGAGVAFLTACADPRVVGLALINPQGEAREELATYLADLGGARYYWRSALLDPKSWRRAIRGESDFRSILRTVLFQLQKRFRRRPTGAGEAVDLARDLRLLAGRDVAMLLVFSEGDQGLDYARLTLDREIRELSARGKLRMDVIPRADHTFSLLGKQDRLLQSLRDWVQPMMADSIPRVAAPARPAGARPRLPPGKRERLARFCDQAGITRRLERAAPQPSLMVLCYHRIGGPEDCLYDPLFSVTCDDLDLQIAYLKSRFHVTTLEEVQERIARRERWMHCEVLLTFDDGYIDSYTQALPILRSHDVQGTFFLPTSFIGTRLLPWWDCIAWMLRRTSKKRLSLRYPVSLEVDLARMDLRIAIQQVSMLYHLSANASRFLTALAESCEVDLPESAPERLFLDWHEASVMLSCGMAVGSHTMSHELLAGLSGDEEYEQVRISRAILRERIGVDAIAMSYPFGLPASFSPRTREAIRRAGYLMGFSYYGGINLPAGIQPFNIRRMRIGTDLSFSLFQLRTMIARATGRELV